MSLFPKKHSSKCSNREHHSEVQIRVSRAGAVVFRVAIVLLSSFAASNGTLASYSQYGATTVDIAAPGSGIYSTVPVRSKGKTIGSYASYNGTSMATPHVTGAAAMYAARHPGSTAAQIKAAILAAAVPTASVTGKVVTGGRLDVSGF